MVKQIIVEATKLIKMKDNNLTFGEQQIWAAVFSKHFNGENVEESIVKASEAIKEIRKAKDMILNISGEAYIWFAQITGKRKWK